jgi:cellulose synthase/poly-beta-1,6-N-acetylglucosamine synthase-like glycosyltransferase
MFNSVGQNAMSGSRLVTIGVPVYNGQRYLEKTLASILAQTLQDFQIVISDNASTDSQRRSAAHTPRKILESVITETTTILALCLIITGCLR